MNGKNNVPSERASGYPPRMRPPAPVGREHTARLIRRLARDLVEAGGWVHHLLRDPDSGVNIFDAEELHDAATGLSDAALRLAALCCRLQRPAQEKA
jgi:hypothetical protein